MVTSGHATYLRDQLLFGFQMPGTVIDIQLEPELPAPGQPFTVQITGVASQVCPPLNFEVLFPAGPDPELRINADTKVCETLEDGTQQCNYDGDCDVDELPIEFSAELEVGAEFWNAAFQPDQLRIQLYVIAGVEAYNANPPAFADLSASWVRTVDFERGTHVVPPRLGSGFWVSEEQPNEGLLIQQQGDQVVFYELAYGPERTAQSNYAGTWLYADFKFSGDSGNGASLKVARPDLSKPDVVFEEMLSSSIIVDDVNHVRALFDAGPGKAGDFITYTSYRRWSFNRDTENLPAVMPDFSGGWTVQRFDGATELERFSLTFDNGAWLDTDRWRFNALEDDASLICKVSNLGEGTCRLEFADSAEVMSFEIADFNGNLASGVFNSGGAVTDEAVFLREPFELPVAQ